MTVRRALALLAVLAAAACSSGDDGDEAAPAPALALPSITLPDWGLGGGDDSEAAAKPPPGGADLPEPQLGEPVERVAIATTSKEVPSIYMALETPRGRPVSVVFAIDASNDQTPDDEAAIRITPDKGDCNVRELRRYRFSGDDRRPVFSRIQAVRGVGPADLPAFMATQVSARLMDGGHATDLEATRPQNVCTQRLWEQLVLVSNEEANEPEGQSGQ